MRTLKLALNRLREPQRKKSAQSIIDNIEIASPCPVSWESMDGDERKRFCGQCQLHVYNITEMTAEEAVDLLIASEGRACVQLFRRKDGTVLTQDCPTGLARLRRALWRRVACLAAAIGWLSLASAAGAKSLQPVEGDGNSLQGEALGGKPSCSAIRGRVSSTSEATQPEVFPAEVQGTNVSTGCLAPQEKQSWSTNFWRVCFAASALILISSLRKKRRKTFWILGLSLAIVFGFLGFTWM